MTTPLWKRVIVYILEGLLALVFISAADLGGGLLV